jgi:predicted ferric reductase
MPDRSSDQRPAIGIGGGVARRRLAPSAWTLVVAAAVTLPLWVLVAAPAEVRGHGWHVASLGVSLVAASLLVLTVLLPSRIRTVTSYLGVERLLRHHRSLALVVVGLVVAHIGFVVIRPGIGLQVLDLRHAPPRVWAGCTAALALFLMVPLATSRRRRRPRYEGWRLVHLVLGNAVLVGTALHVWWLRDLLHYQPAALWLVGLVLCLALLTGYRWLWRPWRSGRNRYIVDEVRTESPDAVTVGLHAVGHSGLRFRPGQFAWLKIGESAYVFEEHPFTIASSAETPERMEFTVKALGDFSEILAGLRPGRTVHLDGPHGSFTLDGLRSRGFVFIAGGVGITPILSMLRTLADRGDPRPVVLIVAGRTADDLLHRADHEHLDDRLDLRLVEVLEEPPVDWRGEIGWLTHQVLEVALPAHRIRAHLDYFVCGPGPMVAAVTRILQEEWGLAPRRVHTELFDVV